VTGSCGRGVRERRGPVWVGAGIAALGTYGFVATLQDGNNFGRVLAACGGISSPAHWRGVPLLTAFVRIGSIWQAPPFAWSVSP
jgi:hypothetical protein